MSNKDGSEYSARSPDTILVHREVLVTFLSKNLPTAVVLDRMINRFPEYTSGNLAYDRRKLRKDLKERVSESQEYHKNRELDRLDSMLQFAWLEFEAAKRGATQELTTNSQKYAIPTIIVDGVAQPGPETVEVERIETQKEVVNNEMVKYWFSQVRDLQKQIAALRGLNHINVNIKKEAVVHVKAYRTFAPHEVWPNLEAGDVVEGEVVE